MVKINFLHDWTIYWCFIPLEITSKFIGWIIRFVEKNYSDNHLLLSNSILIKTLNS